MFGAKRTARPPARRVRDLSELMNVSPADMEKIVNSAPVPPKAFPAAKPRVRRGRR